MGSVDSARKTRRDFAAAYLEEQRLILNHFGGQVLMGHRSMRANPVMNPRCPSSSHQTKLAVFVGQLWEDANKNQPPPTPSGFTMYLLPIAAGAMKKGILLSYPRRLVEVSTSLTSTRTRGRKRTSEYTEVFWRVVSPSSAKEA
jgi:hypothetical protein